MGHFINSTKIEEVSHKVSLRVNQLFDLPYTYLMGHFINSTKIGHESNYMCVSGHKFREGGGTDRHQSYNFSLHRHKVCSIM